MSTCRRRYPYRGRADVGADGARAEAADALGRGDVAAAWPWFRVAPDGALDGLLDLVERRRDAPPDWQRHGLVAWLPGALRRADRIFRLATAAPRP